MDYTSFDIEKAKRWLKENLNEEKFVHSLGTMEAAIKLAQRFNLDVNKAKIAGLLHDCAKCMPESQLNEIVREYQNYCSENEIMHKKVLHAPASAIVAKEKFGVADDEILSSIRWHTLGKIDMTPFEMVIFIADKIEKNTRPKKLIEKIEKSLNKNNSLEEALLKCFKINIKSLIKRKLPICHQTIDVYNDLLNKI